MSDTFYGQVLSDTLGLGQLVAWVGGNKVVLVWALGVYVFAVEHFVG